MNTVVNEFVERMEKGEGDEMGMGFDERAM